MTTIPASEIVNVTPSVISAGGTAINLTGLVLTTTQRVPIGTVQAFSSPAAVQAYFGPGSNEALGAAVYFQADDNSPAKPGQILFAQYPIAPVQAFLRGAGLGSLTLTQLQGFSGSLSVQINGQTIAASIANLAGATSFSNAAALIAADLGIFGPQVGAFTGQQGASFVASGTGTVLTVTAINNGIISVGDVLVGSGVPGGTTIVAQVSGTANQTGVYTTSLSTTASGTITSQSTVLNVTGTTSGTILLTDQVVGTGAPASNFTVSQLSGTTSGVGTYRVSVSAYYPSQSLTLDVPGVIYDSVTNAFQINSSSTGSASTITFATGSLSGSLNLTQNTGAVLSQGTGAATPAGFMTSITQITQNWGTFLLGFNPDTGGGNTQKLAFAAWNSTTNNRYAFVCWDTDASPTTSSNAPNSLGQLIALAGYSGTILVWEPSDLLHEWFVAGWAAALSFTTTNGRRTLAFRNQSGLTPAVTNQQIADNVRANGYNYLGVYGTGAQNFNDMYPGSCSGPFLWADSYMNQIWMNNAFQANLMALLSSVGSIPYNTDGNTLIEAALAPTIQQAGAFGVFRTNVQLSASQVTQVNNAAGGKNIAPTLQTRGWYVSILPTPPSVRQARGSPPCTFFYVDGQSVQQINLASIELQ